MNCTAVEIVDERLGENLVPERTKLLSYHGRR